jgi:glycosyltransferase involved in cell wall biosynthesis
VIERIVSDREKVAGLRARTSRRIRVLQVVHALNYGGAEMVVVQLAQGADRSRFETVVCCCRDLGPLARGLHDQGIEVSRAGPPGRFQNYLRPWHVRRVISRVKPDVVHTHGFPALVEVGQLAALHLVPHWIHTYHFGNYPNFEKPHYMPMERLFSRWVDQLVAVSDTQRGLLIRYHKLRPDRIITITNGVSPNPFVADGHTRARKRSELGLPADAMVVGTVSVLRAAKGITHLLQAAQEIHGRRPDVRFVIVGGGPLEQELRAEARQRHLESVVTFTGWRPDISELLTTFDVFVMSSLWEAMPIALLEAMAARLPIVATDVGQNASIVQDGIGGVIVPAQNAGAIVAAVLDLIDQPSRRAVLAEAAHRRVEQEYATIRTIQRYEDLYARAAAGR